MSDFEGFYLLITLYPCTIPHHVLSLLIKIKLKQVFLPLSFSYKWTKSENGNKQVHTKAFFKNFQIYTHFDGNYKHDKIIKILQQRPHHFYISTILQVICYKIDPVYTYTALNN